jgi:hypothetical protein
MDVPGSATALAPDVSGNTKPNCETSPCVYYVETGMTTAASSPWVIGATEQMVVFVNGDVTINSPIIITPGGFFALIANGNITVSSTVGGAVASAIPTLEGIYIASNAGRTATFSTDASSTVGTERLIIKGSVIADNFTLTRDLGSSNDTTPAEQFIFNPQLLFTMPDVMKEIPYVWQEVAP